MTTEKLQVKVVLIIILIHEVAISYQNHPWLTRILIKFMIGTSWICYRLLCLRFIWKMVEVSIWCMVALRCFINKVFQRSYSLLYNFNMIPQLNLSLVCPIQDLWDCTLKDWLLLFDYLLQPPHLILVQLNSLIFLLILNIHLALFEIFAFTWIDRYVGALCIRLPWWLWHVIVSLNARIDKAFLWRLMILDADTWLDLLLVNCPVRMRLWLQIVILTDLI